MSNPSAPPTYDVAADQKGYEGAPYPQATGYPPVGGYPQTGYGGYPQSGTPQPQPQPYGYQPQPAPSSAVRYNGNQAVVYSAPVAADSSESENGGFSTGDTFSNKSVRRMFIRKVFIILGIQLLVTFGIVAIFTLVDDVRVWVEDNPGFYYASYGVFLVLYIVLICVENVRRKAPLNLIVLGIFTLSLAYMTGTIAAFYDVLTVMITMGVTVLVCAGIILFSMQTRFDFTKCSGVLFVLVWVLFMFGFISIFTYDKGDVYIQVIYGCLGALVFGLFLAFDTQLIMGSKRYELDPEEYVFGALTLYIDVIYIFLFLLSIFGVSSD